jgi:hypothetical protein
MQCEDRSQALYLRQPEINPVTPTCQLQSACMGLESHVAKKDPYSQDHDRSGKTDTHGGPLVGRFTFGVILGLAIGIIDVLLMLPLAFPDKRAALLGAFSSRFALGFFAAVVKLPMSPIASGVLVGVLTSIPDAIVTKAYAPILITGVVFGAIAGWVVDRWAGPL